MLDFELKLPHGYISFTQLNTYLYDPKDYFEKYILGKNFMEELKRTDIARWEKIRLGSIFQDAWSDPRFNWKKKLKEGGFTPDKERIIETALKSPHMLKFPMSKCEQTIRGINYKGVPLLIKTDAFDEEKKLLVENKFGAPRSQDYVDEDLQLSFYALGIKLQHGFTPKIILQSVNDRTGKVKVLKTKRGKEDLDHIGGLILKVAEGISKEIWQKE